MPQPFALRILDSDIADLRERLARTRFPDSTPGEPWAYGTDVDYLRSLVDYWRETFDWRAEEARLNAFPQLKMTRPDYDLHFLHVPGKGQDPTPLLLMHGWPGSVFEFLDFIRRLTDPARFGVEEIADCLAELMTDTLGYKRFAVQGGDWGGITAARMGATRMRTK
jgi:Epoxide hydrolase N terminus